MDKITQYRAEIESIDAQIIRLIGDRIKVVRRIGGIKRREGVGVVDLEREKRLALFHKEMAGKTGIDEQMTAKIFDIIIKESRRQQV